MPGRNGCHVTRMRLWDHVDRRLPEAEDGTVVHHLAGCARCRRAAAGTRQLQLALRGESARPMPADVRRRLEGLIDRLAGEPPAVAPRRVCRRDWR